MAKFPRKIRPYRESDRNLILSSWFNSWRDDADVPLPVCRDSMNYLTKDLLSRGGALVAVAPDDDNHIYGWLCGEYFGSKELIIHWVYVKHVFRQDGIACALLKKANVTKRRPLTGFVTRKSQKIIGRGKYDIQYVEGLLHELKDYAGEPVARKQYEKQNNRVYRANKTDKDSWNDHITSTHDTP